MSGQQAETFQLRCDRLYKQRIYELKKYVIEMFLNIERNEVLRELHGTPELEQIKSSKIQEIVREALQGEKERQVQMLVEKNITLLTELEIREGVVAGRSDRKIKIDMEKQKSQLEELRKAMQEQHERELDCLENQFKQLLRQTLTNYESYLLEKINSDNRSQFQSLQKLHQTSMSQLSEQFELRLQGKQLEIQKLKKMLSETQINSQQVLHLVKINETLQAQNTEHVRNILQLETMLKSQQLQIRELSELVQTYSQHETQISELKKSIPQMTFRSELELFKMKQEYQTQMYKQKKDLQQEIVKLRREHNSQIQELKKKIKQYSHESSTTFESSPQIKKVGRISSNKGRYKTMQDDFQSGLYEMKSKIKRSPILRKVSFLCNV